MPVITDQQQTRIPLLQRAKSHPWLIATGALLVAIVASCLGVYVHYYRVVTANLKSGAFSHTANIYAAPRTITPGEAVNAEAVVQMLRLSGYSPARDNPAGYFVVNRQDIDIYPGPRSYFRRQGARITFAGNRVGSLTDPATNAPLEAYSLEPELITNLAGSEREKRRMVQFQDIPKVLVDAVVSIEDKRFFEHMGFDPFRLAKAAYVDLKDGKKEQGASTLTMQLARNLWLDPEKKWRRKLNELMITMVLEQHLSKQEIFTYYANQVYLGQQDTFSVHGFGEAAHAYFERDLQRLTLPQAALLAGLIQRPSYFNPFRYPDRATARRNTVLHLMHQNGYISAAEFAEASEAPLGVVRTRSEGNDWPYFLALVNDELQDRLPDNTDPGSYQVYTSLDPDLQRAAVEAVHAGMAKVDPMIRRRKHWDGTLPQVALIAMDPHTGEVKAAVGGRDYGKSQLNHVLSMRQPGSSFKPFVYAAALDSKRFTEASTVADVPTTFTFGNQIYQPQNFEKTFHGDVTLRYALAQSLNVATVNVAQKVGYGRIVELARAAGLNDKIQPTPAVALGAYEATPLEMAGAYTIFANEGVFVEPTFLHEVRTPEAVIVHGSPDSHRVLNPQVAFLVRELMQEVMRSGTAAGVRSMGFKGNAAGKTGTSRDGWFAGFTPNLLCIVWIGFDDNRELDLEGAKSALPVWAEFMKRAQSLYPANDTFPKPPAGVVSARVDPTTGQLAGPYCPTALSGYFLSGTEPRIECQAHTDPFGAIFSNTADRVAPPPPQ